MFDCFGELSFEKAFSFLYAMRIVCSKSLHKAAVSNDVRFAVFKHIEAFFDKHFKNIFVVVAGSYALRNFCICRDVDVTIVPDDIDIYVSVDNIATVFAAFSNFLYETTFVIGDMKMRGCYLYGRQYIHGILDILLVEQEPFKTFRIQIICFKDPDVNTYGNKEDFATSIISNYDISVCRVAILSAKYLEYFFLLRSMMHLTSIPGSFLTQLLTRKYLKPCGIES